jgi:hypothetical protein
VQTEPDGGRAAGDVGGQGGALWWSLAFTTASLVLHAPGFVVRLFNSDEASLASMAMAINRGATLYHTTADRKPPIVPYVYALVFRVTGSVDIRYVRVVAAVAVGLCAALLALEARRRYGSRRAGLGCGALFLLAVTAFFPDDSQAAGFEVFMLLPMTAAVVLAARRRYLGAGLALAAACLCKQTAAMTAVPVLWWAWRWGGAKAVGRCTAGFVAPIAAAAALFGPGPFLLWTVSGNRGYLAAQGSMGAAASRALGMTAALAGLELGLVVLVLVAVRRRWGDVDLWLWLSGGVVAVAAGLRFFGHYYLQLLPPMALIAAPVLATVGTAGRRILFGGAALPASVCAVVAFVPTGDAASVPYQPLATQVREVTTAQDTVFVWGDLPELYWAARRVPGTRFIHTGFLTGNTGGRPNGTSSVGDGLPGAWSMLAADFQRRLPDLIVDTTAGAIRQSELYPMSSTWVWPLVRSDYRLVGTLDGVRFYKHAAPPPGTLAAVSAPNPGLLSG